MTRLRFAPVLVLSLASGQALPAQENRSGNSEGPSVELPVIGEVPVPGFLATLLGIDTPQGGGGGQGGQQTPAVVYHVVETASVGDTFRFLGRIAPIERVSLQARVPGFIEEVAFEGGETVERGKLLFQIQKEQYEAALDSAQAQLAGAEAQLSEAERQLERQQELRQSGTVSEANLEDARARAEAARADRLQAQAAVEQAKLDLGYTTIEAPIDGQMSAPLLTRGNYVTPSAGPLADLVQIDPIWGVFSLGENNLVMWRRLGLGAQETAPVSQASDGESQVTGSASAPSPSPSDYRLRLLLPDGSTYAREGEFAFVGNSVDAQTGTVEVRIRFENPDGMLLPNQNVTLRVEEADPPVLPLVPQEAIQLGRDGRAVWIVNEDDTVSRRPIEVEAGPDVATAAVTRGLEGGEHVVVRGALSLSEGQKVDPRRAGDGGAGAPAGSGQGGGSAQGGGSGE